MKKRTSTAQAEKKKSIPTPIQEPANTTPLTLQIFTLFSLLITTIIAYASSLPYPFQFDDLSNITKRFSLRADNPLTRWASNPRWVGDWFNALNYKIGGFNPWYYRATNLAIHCFMGALVFLFTLRLCSMARHAFFKKHSLALTTIITGLFLLHPVQTQTISYIIQGRVEGLASLCILATLLSFVLLRQARSSTFMIIWAALTLLSTLLACGCKEIVVVTLPLMLLVDWFFVAQEEWTTFKKGAWFYAGYIPYFIFLVNHYFLNIKFAKEALSMQMNLVNNSGNVLTQDPNAIIKPAQFFISEFKVILHYITMFIWPFNISVEYDWKLSHNIFDTDVILPGLLLATIVLTCSWYAIKKRYAYITAPILWFFICIAPRSTIIPSPELACDYKTYLASYGVLFLLGCGFIWFLQKIADFATVTRPSMIIPRATHATGALILLIPLGFATTQRNTIWRSTLDFWEDCSHKAPFKARAHNNYGVALCEAGRFQEAIYAYKKAIALDGLYHDPWSNIAVAYSMLNNPDKAISALRKAISIQAHYPEAYNNLGSLYLEKKDYVNAEKMLNIAIKLRPYYGKAHFNFARLYELQNNLVQSWESLKKATEGDLDTPECFFKFGQMSLRVGKYAEGLEALKKVQRLTKQHNPQVTFNIANCHFMLGELEKAEPLYSQLMASNPKDYRYPYNLAEVYVNRKNFEKALPLYQKALDISGNAAQVAYRHAVCLAELKRYPEAKETLLQATLANNTPEMKNALSQELARLELEEKVYKGNGKIKLADLKHAVKQQTV